MYAGVLAQSSDQRRNSIAKAKQFINHLEHTFYSNNT